MSKPQSRTITQPADWWAAVAAAAKAAGVSRAVWIHAAGVKALPPKVAKSLSEKQAAHRPKKNISITKQKR